jgi:hypothetical protein
MPITYQADSRAAAPVSWNFGDADFREWTATTVTGSLIIGTFRAELANVYLFDIWVA